MSVIVDSDVWSELLRKVKGELSPQVKTLMALIDDEESVVLIGAIRQEVLGGWRYPHQFEQVRKLMEALPSRYPTDQAYELAAEYFNTCRSKGIQGSSTDFLICACASLWNLPILTKDQDYQRYVEHVPVRLYPVA